MSTDRNPLQQETPVSQVTPASSGGRGPGVDTLEFATPAPSGSAAAGGAVTAAGPRYRKVRLAGQGGVGQVFVAEDQELVREVALKEIQPRFADEATSRARFLAEAEITGGLEHPGIVPIYGLGVDPAGRPFYAMRLIRGETLSEAIRRFHRGDTSAAAADERGLEFRKLLARLISACEAVAYAHSRGIVHRDLKPDNIMLGAFGETLVVDWGVAKPIGGTADASQPPVRPRSDAGYTPHAGTPAYMSPEQADLDSDAAGPASDVYSLGATLYEILTGRPPLAKDELPETPREALDRVRQQEVPRPSRVAPAVPADLEAICLKALARRPDDRYATPRTMAEDLERWLADEPVAARNPGPYEQSLRWVRKHPTWSASLAVFVLLGTVASLGYAWMLAGKNAEIAEANGKLSQAVTVARDQNRLSLETLNFVIFEVQRGLEGLPGAGRVRRELLAGVLARLQQVSTQYQQRPNIDRSTAVSMSDLGDMMLEVGGDAGFGTLRPSEEGSAEPVQGSAVEAARKVYERAHAIQKQLAELSPQDLVLQRDLANSLGRLGHVALREGRPAVAAESLQQALVIRRRLMQEQPGAIEPRREAAFSAIQLGNAALDAGRFPLAGEVFDEGHQIYAGLAASKPAEAREQRDLSIAMEHLAALDHALGRTAQAAARMDEALAISRARAEASPGELQAERDLIVGLEQIAAAQSDAGDMAAARKLQEEALSRLDALRAKQPAVGLLDHDRIRVLSNLARFELAASDVQKSLAHLQECEQASRAWSEADPQDAAAKHQWAVVLKQLGDVAFHQVQLDEAAGHYRAALDRCAELLKADPEYRPAQEGQAAALVRLAEIEARRDRFAKARELFDEALRVRKNLVSTASTSNGPKIALAQTARAAADTEVALKQVDAAIKFNGLALTLCREVLASAPEQQAARETLVQVLLQSSDLLTRKTLADDALEALDKAQKEARLLADSKTHHAQGERLVSLVLATHGDLDLKAGRFEAAEQKLRESLAKSRALAAQFKDDPLYPTDMINTLHRLDLALANQYEYRKAEEAAREGLRLRDELEQRSQLVGDPRMETWKKEFPARAAINAAQAAAVERFESIAEAPPEQQAMLYTMRGKALIHRLDQSLAAAGNVPPERYAEIEATADALLALEPKAVINAFVAGRVLARAVPVLRRQPMRSDLIERSDAFARRTVAALEEARARGLPGFAGLEKEPDFAPLKNVPAASKLFEPEAKPE